ncbi:MAG TPA: sialidase family protein, partial [Candidatus Methylacidiphilales bacterium]|nr:sialidase family protein [Candidatus Methylacidiphilales bacterium]
MNRCLFFIRRSPPVFAVGFLCLGLANCSEKPKGSSDPQIQSVLQKGDTIIASTSDGIYEASQTEKVWRKQVTPISMQNGGSLVQESAVSPKLVYYTGWGGFGFPTNGKEGCLFVSEDAGKTWTPSSLSQNVMHAFITPDGSIFAATEGIVTTPPPPRGGYLTWTTDKDGVKHYPSVHLLVSRDNGHGWKDITPPLQSGFGLDSIFQDPDHPNRVCVSSSAINHSSRDFFYQASDDTYSSWREIRDDDWSGGHKQLYSLDFLGSIGAGGDVGATLGNFFKFPFPRSGNGPSLPNGNLVCEKAVYSFHLEQPMPVSVRTFFMFPT